MWYGVALKENQVLATHYSFEEPDNMALIKKLPKNNSFRFVKVTNPLSEDVLSALNEIFNGEDNESYGFKMNITDLSSYLQKVLNCTRLIPVGYVTSYGAIAKVVGGIPRSVGHAEANNTLPLIIPCHRVVCSDLSIGGYGQGEQTKISILQREERGYEKSIKRKVNGKELIMYPTKWIKGKRR